MPFRAPALLLASGLTLASCTHLPVSSMLALRNVDFTKTELTSLRAAVKLPRELKPRDTRLTFIISPKGGGRHERSFLLSPIEDAGAAEVAGVKPTERLHAYRFAERDVLRLQAFREEMVRASLAPGGSLTVNVSSKACRDSDSPLGSTLMTTYLRTAETGRYVPLVRDVDLSDVKRGENLAENLPRCEAGAGSGPALSGLPGAS